MRLLFVLCMAMLLAACQSERSTGPAFPQPSTEGLSPDTIQFSGTKEQYYDRVLGSLVGSAIGDAMGSPVEMWSKEMIQERHGFVDDLILNIRPASPEGPWASNMPAGTSTDDTRWKYLAGQFLLELQTGNALNDRQFAQFISRQYDQLKSEILQKDGLQADRLETNLRYLQWLQEWVKVADAFSQGDVQAYATAVSKFYGGEMSCAGMLYAPLFGLCYPQQAQKAYQQTWPLTLFDLGYAKDISAMTSALVAAAFDDDLSTDSLLRIHHLVDHQSYADSRLIGRIVNSIYEDALSNYRSALKIDTATFKGDLPDYFEGDSLRYQQLLSMYEGMDRQLKDIPFHANEIYRITLNALLFAQNDFMDAMVFITNFGRDNDTAGAVAGAILGTQLGFQKLPREMRDQVLEANKNKLNINLEQLAQQLTDRFYLSE
ncbi:MAG: ADP-ribosylglycohydrolase family protein [Bacteroidota bacterium]